MRTKRILFSPAALDRNGISVAQTTAGAANLTITGALASGGVATMDIPRHLGIYCAGDVSGVTFTITGTDRYGRALTETITGVNATTVEGTKNFKTVTQVAADGAVGTNVEVGTVDSFESQWVPLNRYTDATTVGIDITASASMTCGTQYTLMDVQSSSFDEHAARPVAQLSGKTTTAETSFSDHFTAIRLTCDDFVSGSVTLYINEAC